MLATKVRHVVEERAAHPDEQCYDAHAPFGLQHYGKLALPADLRHLSSDFDPPRSHCVGEEPGTGTLSVVRFTRFCLNQSLNARLQSPDLIAEIHERHLTKLGQLGIHPWYTDIAVGSHPTAPEGGLYIAQDLLPLDAEVGLTRYADRVTLAMRISQYHSWARDNGEPGYLEDLVRGENVIEEQCSKVGSDIVLHDVEPLYSVYIP